MKLKYIEIFKALFNKKWIIFFIAFSFALFSLVLNTFIISPKFTTNALFYVSPNRLAIENLSDLNELRYSQTLVHSYLIILENDAFLRKVSQETDLGYTYSQIKDMISLSSVNNTEIFELSISSNSPQHSFEIINSIINSAPDEIIRVRKYDSVRIISQPSSPPTTPSSPNIPLNVAIGGFIGIILSCLVIILLNILDTRVKDAVTFVERYEIPVLGTIPDFDS